MEIETHKLKSNGYFSIIGITKDVKKFYEHWDGTDDCIKVLNEATGEHCFKRIYKNKKGLHFKHSGTRYQGCPSVMYLKDFTVDVVYVPFQVLEGE